MSNSFKKIQLIISPENFSVTFKLTFKMRSAILRSSIRQELSDNRKLTGMAEEGNVMLKKFLSLIFALLIALGNFTQAYAGIDAQTWAGFSFYYKDSKTFGEPPDSFKITGTGFTCTTKTARWVIIDGKERQARLYIHWTFDFEEDGIYYDNDYKGDDEDFEDALSDAILQYVMQHT